MEKETISIPLESWYELAVSGIAPAVKTTLDGYSMQPLIRRKKDLVTIVPLFRSLKKGDIVLFRSAEGSYVVHRIWKIRGKQLQTFGDNCWKADAWIDRSQVYGLVIKVKRNNREWMLDTLLSRNLGRLWQLIHPARFFYKKVRNRVCRFIRNA
ncbi:MAG: S24/S26 family peptidase [Lachnospiraceae bacterium]|nr:S24/S26 family peptidase [Lachnospiraceae bacterium]